MKNVLLTLLAAAAFASTASATVSIAIWTDGLAANGANASVICDVLCVPAGIAGFTGATAAADTVGFAGTVGYNNANFNGWRISGITGVSNSPSNNPVGLDLSSLTATCFAATCADLTVLLSDTGFAGVGGFQSSFSGTITGAGSTATQTAYFGANLFDRAPANQIGSALTITPPSGNANTGGGSAGPAAYSETIRQVFHVDNNGTASFSVDGNITQTPEPTAIVLTATLFALSAKLLRRKKLV